MWNDLSCSRGQEGIDALAGPAAGGPGMSRWVRRLYRAFDTIMAHIVDSAVDDLAGGRTVLVVREVRNPTAMPRKSGVDCNDWERLIIITRDAGRRSNTARCRRLGWRRCRTPPEAAAESPLPGEAAAEPATCRTLRDESRANRPSSVDGSVVSTRVPVPTVVSSLYRSVTIRDVLPVRRPGRRRSIAFDGTGERTASPPSHKPMTRTQPDHATAERHLGGRGAWLRAGVLGANDGLISTASLMVAVAAASSSRSAVLVAGIAGLTAGALSMAAGEYVSVSSQRDTERARSGGRAS